MSKTDHHITYVGIEDIKDLLLPECWEGITETDVEYVAQEMEKMYLAESYQKHLRLALYKLFDKKGENIKLWD